MRTTMLAIVALAAGCGSDPAQPGSPERPRTAAPAPRKIAEAQPEPEPANVKLTAPPRLATGTARYVDDAFTMLLPDGWEAKPKPQTGFEIGFLKTGVPGAHWFLHTQRMPKGAGEPPSDVRTLRAMAAQFDRGVQQQYPGASSMADLRPKLIGKTLIHVRYRLAREGRTDIISYDYIYKDGTAYVIHASCPETHQAALQPELDILFSSFTPKKGGAARRRPHKDVTGDLERTLPTFAATMRSDWRPSILSVKVEPVPDAKGTTLVIRTAWSNPALVRDYGKLMKATRSIAQDPGKEVEVPASMPRFVHAAGQLLGFAAVAGDEAAPPITYYAVEIRDPDGNPIGHVTIQGSDLLRITSGTVGGVQAIGLYRFE